MDKERADARAGPNDFLMYGRTCVLAGFRAGLETSTSGSPGVGNEFLQLFRVGGGELACEALA